MIRRFVLPAMLIAVLAAAAVWAQNSAQTTRREPQFENEHVRVWKSIIIPKQPLSLHRHDHGRTIVALKGGQLKVVDKNGHTLDTYNWESGKAYWLGPDPPGQMHGDLNDTDQTIEVIVVEMRK